MIKPFLSIIIPVYNGEKTIEVLFKKILLFCQKNNYTFEVLFVWDSGPDDSWKIIEGLKNSYPDFIRAIKLSRNFGQHNAIISGFSCSKGTLIITMDEDLQHDPQDIEKLISEQKAGDYDVVYAIYDEKKHSAFRNITSKLLRKLIKIGIPELHEDYSAFRILKNDIALSTTKMSNSYTFLDGYISWITTNISSCKVEHHERIAGNSSYTLKKLISHSVNIFFTFSDLPIKMVTTLSFLFFIFTFFYSSWVIFRKLIFNSIVPGFTSIIVLLGLGIGSILLSLGILGQYLHKINAKTTKRPNYIIREIL